MTWDLPYPPNYFQDRLSALHRLIRDHLRGLMEAQSSEELARPAEAREGDTIFAIDERAESVLESYFTKWGEEVPVLLIAEGFPGDGGKTYPAGTPRHETAFTCIVDPIDGTRGLMYQKRSAWILTGVAPRSTVPRTIASINFAMQTEIPTLRSQLSDMLWAAVGAGVRAETQNLWTGRSRPFVPRPSTADSLDFGFATIAKFFPGGKVAAIDLEERLFTELLGPPLGNPRVFDDQYISSGGQLYELIMGHDRFTADLRPFLAAKSGDSTTALAAHPYDLCTELVAREAGVIVTDARAERISAPLDVRVDCNWIGYANGQIRDLVEPVLQRLLLGKRPFD